MIIRRVQRIYATASRTEDLQCAMKQHLNGDGKLLFSSSSSHLVREQQGVANLRRVLGGFLLILLMPPGVDEDNPIYITTVDAFSCSNTLRKPISSLGSPNTEPHYPQASDQSIHPDRWRSKGSLRMTQS